MFQLQLDGFDAARSPSASGSGMPEDKVPAGPKGDGSDRAARDQLSLIVPVLPNVVMPVFVSVKTEKAHFSSCFS